MEKKNVGLKVLVVILSLLVVGLSGFIVYDKLLSNNEVENNDNNELNDNVNNNMNTNTNNNYQNTQEYIGFVNPEEHVEVEKNIKPKLVEVFKFVYNYNKSKFYGNYCVGDVDKNDTINPPSGADSLHKHNIASTEYSSFEEMMDYLKTYMTPNVIYNNDRMTIDNFIEKDGKLYCPYFETNKGGIYAFKDAKIKYSKPYETHIYVTMETTLFTNVGGVEEYATELFDVTFTKKNNNWVISSYSQFKYA